MTDYQEKYKKYKIKYLELLKNINSKQTGGTISLNNINIIKTIGKGMHGTVYLVSDNNNNNYAMKIEPIFEKDIKQSLSSPIWREIEFCNTMNSKYPNHFIILYDHKIDNKCNHIQRFDFKMELLPKAQQTYYIKLFASKFCSVKLFSLIDMTLDQLFNSWKTFNKKVFYNLCIQYVYVIYLMKKEGYLHRDFHTKNTGVIKTTKKYITIFDKNIKTYGYLVQAIDFGLVINKKYKLKNYEKNSLKYSNDLLNCIYDEIHCKTYNLKIVNN